MSKLTRVFNFFKCFMMFLIGAIILLVPDDVDYIIVCVILGTVITLRGIRKLFFYISSARCMVGGERVLINSFIYIDLGFLSFIVLLVNQSVAMLYMVGIFVLMGVIDILRCVEIKKNGSKTWVLKLIKGIITIGAAAACFIFAQSIEVMLLVFGISWIVLGIEGVVASFSKASVEYIPEI